MLRFDFWKRVKQTGPTAVLFTSVGFACIGFLVVEYIPSMTVFLIVAAILVMFDDQQ